MFADFITEYAVLHSMSTRSVPSFYRLALKISGQTAPLYGISFWQSEDQIRSRAKVIGNTRGRVPLCLKDCYQKERTKRTGQKLIEARLGTVISVEELRNASLGE